MDFTKLIFCLVMQFVVFVVICAEIPFTEHWDTMYLFICLILDLYLAKEK